MATTLTPEQIEGFRTEGYLSPVRVMGETEAEGYRARYETFRERWPEHVKKLKTKAHVLCPWVDEIARHEGVLDAFEGLIGPDILCYSMAFRPKGPDRATHAGWHQDSAYIKIEPIMILAALALSPVTVENGCLRVIPGSHAWGPMNHADSDDPHSILARGQSITDPFDDSAAVAMELRPGEVGFFDFRAVHGSGPNLTDDTRLMLLVEMMPAAASQGEGRETAMLVRGEDRYGHFLADPHGLGEATLEALAAWERTVAIRAGNVYRAATVEANEAYAGRRKAV
ncbi:MAG: phytanoyl-CoA dioxygenase family protein [Rhodospirillaceae bacterium]|nr:phytanoyl-CoA dioxygenase family protein [Rhodospirillaceae bacterium]MBT6117781.1 phytanoyl-CoA dioxygenase family protein [Rhodospirillaceae bacterium]